MPRTIRFEDADGVEHDLPTTFEVCENCGGEGTHVHRAIDGHGLGREDFDEDPDFAEAYYSGAYDVRCDECKGERVIAVVDEARIAPELLAQYWGMLEDEANDRAEAAQERRMFGY